MFGGHISWFNDFSTLAIGNATEVCYMFGGHILWFNDFSILAVGNATSICSTLCRCWELGMLCWHAASLILWEAITLCRYW